MNTFGLRRNHHIMWDPTKLSGGTLYAWFDASVLSTLTLVNSGGTNYVSQWNSIIGGSSKSLTQSIVARRPIYRYSPFNKWKPAVRFFHNNSDTTNPYLNGANIGAFNSSNTQLHMFVACMQIDDTIRAVTGDTTENQMGIFCYQGFPGGLFLKDNSSGKQTGVQTGWYSHDLSTNLSTTIALPSPQRKVMCFGGTIYGGLTGTWYTSVHVKGYIPQRPSATSALNRRQYPTTDVWMGTAYQPGGTYAYPFGGEIYEFLLITGTITLNTKTKILEYLDARWGP